ncbi:MAG TPA: hypothetical protein VIS06_19020 [Mycobacteriales bacterium]
MTPRKLLAVLPVLAIGLLAVPAAPTAALAGTPLTSGAVLTGGAPKPPPPAPAPVIPTLVAIRAAHHPGYDRLVFEFRGGLPQRHDVNYVPVVIADGSGEPVPLAGDAFLHVVFSPAVGHDDAGHGTFGPTRRTTALPQIIQVATAGDFEAVLSFGVGLARRTPFHVFTLTNPSRVVIDVTTPFRTVSVRDYFLFKPAFDSGHPPFVRAVRRPVIPPAVGRGALQRLFAGPTNSEFSAALRFVASGATGFTNLSVSNGIARVRLTGGCSSGGSTFTIADEIFPTLKQFPTVRWVKIFDPAGHTERPSGNTDSIPECLEP